MCVWFAMFDLSPGQTADMSPLDVVVDGVVWGDVAVKMVSVSCDGCQCDNTRFRPILIHHIRKLNAWIVFLGLRSYRKKKTILPSIPLFPWKLRCNINAPELEAADSTVRQHFFVDQGYTFEEITSLSFIDLNCNLSYDEQIELLNQVLYAEDDMVVMEQEVRIFFVELSIDPSIIGGEVVELGNQVELAALLHDMGDYKYTKLSVSFAASNFDEKESRNRLIADGRLYAQAASQCRYLWPDLSEYRLA
ncbi:hypothetical protein ZIOFF_035845 [Zingiber officinale]|uniref:ERCC3/RAD25/XPB helicase C-terminal domain-containing protein n=1 Tax=Zingiber officinale TaxID=94328 RepID=A0A8J5L7D9_ZINOF|nr:hypothetical protein ZIOFF_035845 [Zingiber officinale]